MRTIKLSLPEYLLMPGAFLFLLTNEEDEIDAPHRSIMERMRDKIAFAKAQSVDVYLGSRH
jgi:hypothetical protein